MKLFRRSEVDFRFMQALKNTVLIWLPAVRHGVFVPNPTVFFARIKALLLRLRDFDDDNVSHEKISDIFYACAAAKALLTFFQKIKAWNNMFTML